MEPLDINVEIAAAAAVPEIVEAVKQSARTKLEKLTEEYDPVIAKYPTSVRNQFSSGMSKHGIPHTVFLDKPVADTQDSGGKKYSKHVVNDPKTHMAWFNLYDSEDAVVMHELRKPEVICWYRNPVGKTTGQSLRIPYRLGDDRKVLHPDFIFFEKVGDRESRPLLIRTGFIWPIPCRNSKASLDMLRISESLSLVTGLFLITRDKPLIST